MDPIQNKVQAATKSGKLKITITIIVIAIIAAAAYHFFTKTASAPTNDIGVQNLPVLSSSDDVASLKADLGSTGVATTDLSSFDAEVNAK